MRYITSTHIAKRCPNGKWKDDDGQCIPIEEWKAKHHRDSPKEKTDADIKNRETAERVREMRTHYGIPEETRKEVKKFYNHTIDSPFKKSEDCLRMIDKALEDDSVPLNKVFEVICKNQKDSEGDFGWTRLSRIENPRTRKAILTGLKNTLEICPYVAQSVWSVSLEKMWDGVWGQSWQNGGDVELNSNLYLGELSAGNKEVLLDALRYDKVINPLGEEDTLSWNFCPRDVENMSEEEVIGYACQQTLTHEFGHSIGGYLENLTSARDYFIDMYSKEDAERYKNLNLHELYTIDREKYIDLFIENRRKEVLRDVTPEQKETVDGFLDELREIIDKYWVFEPSDKIKKECEDALEEWEDKVEDYVGSWVYASLPNSVNFSHFNHCDSSNSCIAQNETILECLDIYKELYGLTDETLNPFDIWSEYGYYAGQREASKDEPSKMVNEKAPLRDSDSFDSRREDIASERIAEAFGDVCTRGEDANTMSVLVVSCVNYNIYKAISGTDVTFKEYFFGDSMESQRTQMKDNRRIKSRDRMRYITYAIMKSNAIAKRCPPGYHITPDGCRRLIDGKPTGELLTQSQEAEASKPKKPKKQDNVLDARHNKIVSRDSREGKIVLAMRDGSDEDAQQSRKNYIKLVNEIGYYPVVLPIDEFKSYGKTFDGTKTTYDTFVNEDGTYDEKRQKLHDKIIAQYLKKMKRRDGDKQIAMFLGGGSASGKGSMDETLMKDFGITDKKELEDFKIDPDAIMEFLPEYKKYPPELRASACHREASDIAEALFYVAMRNNVSFIFDGTFSSEKPVKFAQGVDKDKYEMLYRGVVAEPDDCVFFSNKRFVEGSKKGLARLVPESVIRDTNKGARDIRKKYVKDSDLFNDAKLFSESKGRHKFYVENKDTFFK